MSVFSLNLGIATALGVVALALPAGAQTTTQPQDAGAGTAPTDGAQAKQGPGPEAPTVQTVPGPNTPPEASTLAAAGEPASPPKQEGKLALAAGAGGTAPPATSPELPKESAPPSAEPPVATAAPAGGAPEWTRNVSIGGGAIVYYYQPTKGDAKNNVSVFFANLLLDGKWDRFGLHIEPRFRDTKLRPYYDGPVWLQEAYGSFTYDPVTLKVGKIYKQSGLFWDNSFYGNVQVYDGLKLDPNYGLSLEGSVGDKLGAAFAGQYFVVDGRTNVSLQNRDTISYPGANRRNTFVARVEPFFKFGGNDAGQVRIGGTAEFFEAQFANEDNDDEVTRVAGHGKFTYQTKDFGSVGVWGEYLHQNGKHVTDFPIVGDPDATPPIAGEASGDNDYFEVGGEYTFWRLTARYNVSQGNYKDVNVKEILHVPALGVKVDDHLGLLGEYVIWKRDTDAGTIDIDRSLNVTLNGHF